jgi:hypothetical protein
MCDNTVIDRGQDNRISQLGLGRCRCVVRFLNSKASANRVATLHDRYCATRFMEQQDGKTSEDRLRVSA